MIRRCSVLMPLGVLVWLRYGRVVFVSVFTQCRRHLVTGSGLGTFVMYVGIPQHTDHCLSSEAGGGGQEYHGQQAMRLSSHEQRAI